MVHKNFIHKLRDQVLIFIEITYPILVPLLLGVIGLWTKFVVPRILNDGDVWKISLETAMQVVASLMIALVIYRLQIKANRASLYVDLRLDNNLLLFTVNNHSTMNYANNVNAFIYSSLSFDAIEWNVRRVDVTRINSDDPFFLKYRNGSCSVFERGSVSTEGGLTVIGKRSDTANIPKNGEVHVRAEINSENCKKIIQDFKILTDNEGKFIQVISEELMNKKLKKSGL